MLCVASRPFRLGLAAITASAVFAIVQSAPGAAASARLLGCEELVYDPDGLIDRNEIYPLIARTAATLDADPRIRVEASLDGGLDQRIDQLRRQCARWDGGDGKLADDLVVVMFSPAERENAIFFGDSSGPAPAVRWDEATDAMIPHLQDGAYTEAVDAALRELRDVSSSSSPASRDDGGEFGRRHPHGPRSRRRPWDRPLQQVPPRNKRRGRLRGWGRPRRRRFRVGVVIGEQQQPAAPVVRLGGAARRSRSSSRRSGSRRSRRAGGGSKKW